MALPVTLELQSGLNIVQPTIAASVGTGRGVLPRARATAETVAFPPEAGFEVILQRNGTSDSQTGWSTIGDPAPSNGTELVQTYPNGLTGGSSPSTVVHNSGFSESVIWFRQRVRLSTSPGFYGHSSGFNKNIYATIGGGNLFFTYFSGVGDGTLLFCCATQGTTSDPGGKLYTTTTPCVRGVQYDMWGRIQGNSASTANGSVQLWVDGVRQQLLVLGVPNDADDIQWTSGASTVQQLGWPPQWGGLGQVVGLDGVPIGFTMNQGDLTIAAPV